MNTEQNYLSVKEGNDLGVKIHNLLGFATYGERSLWTANKLRDFAERNDMNTLHYIGGVAHTTEIAYFLQNPDFSFERLDEYRMSRK